MKCISDLRIDPNLIANQVVRIGHRSLRWTAAVAAVAAGSAVALAGGKMCLILSNPPIDGTRVEASSVTGIAAGGVTLIAPGGGYCPGGLPPHSEKAIDGLDAGDPEAVKAALNEIDAVDAAMIAKAQFAGATKVHSVKFEPADTDGIVKGDWVWKVELSTSSHDEWSITVDTNTGLIAKQPYPPKKELTNNTAEIEDLALHNPEPIDGMARKPLAAAPLNDVEAIDMFDAIDLVACKLEALQKDDPEPVPTVKTTDRPQPKLTPSTGSYK